MTNSGTIANDGPARSPADKPSRAAGIAGFRMAVHELRIKGRVPEISKVIEKEMTSDEAVASIVARFRDDGGSECPQLKDVAELPARKHHNANQVFRLMLGRRIACMVRQDTSILALVKAEVDRMREEPHLGDAVSAWDRLLSASIEDIAEMLSADDPYGDYLRETMPCFVSLDHDTMTELVLRSRRAFAAEGAME